MFRAWAVPALFLLAFQLHGAKPYRGAGVVVAVIGPGVAYELPLLGGGLGPSFKVRAGHDFVDNDPEPTEARPGQGTVMAAVIAASTSRYTGIAPEASLLAYRVQTEQQIADAIRRAVRDGAHVIVVSAMTDGTADGPAEGAVNDAVAAGAVVVAAAGAGSDMTGRFSAVGAAEKAITAGDSFHGGDRSSSRGPTLFALRFKPDVVADDYASIDGTLISWGTDIAAANVAGMCALLREAHPGWSPLEIKSAIATTAQATDLKPLEGGSGHADLVKALQASVFVDKTSLSFGMHSAATGRRRVTKSFRVHNDSASPRTFAISSTSEWEIEQSVEPRRVTIPGGGTAVVKLTLAIDYATLPFPDDFGVGGVVTLEGDTTLRVPWGFLRGARASVDYDLAMTSPVTVFDALKHSDFVYPWKPGKASLFVKPGPYDVIIAEKAYQTGYDVRVVIAEQRLISFDETVTLRRADATIPVNAAGVDERGVPFATRHDGSHYRLLHIGIKDHGEYWVDSYALFESNVLVSPLSERVQLIAAEWFIETGYKRAYSLLHEPQNGLREAKTFVNDPGVYKRATFERDRNTPVQLCLEDGYVQNKFLQPASCITSTSSSVEFLAAGENEFVFQGLRYEDDRVRTPMLRVFGGELVLADPLWWIPDPMAPRVADRSTIRFGAGPVRAGLRIVGHFVNEEGGAGYYGALGEYLQSSSAATWKLLDEGWLVKSGRFGESLQYRDLYEGGGLR